MGFTFSAEKSNDTRSGSTENLERRIAEYRRGSNHTTYRFSGDVQNVAAKQIASTPEARNLDRILNGHVSAGLGIWDGDEASAIAV